MRTCAKHKGALSVLSVTAHGPLPPAVDAPPVMEGVLERRSSEFDDSPQHSLSPPHSLSSGPSSVLELLIHNISI
ncbi:hypothetical protein OH77DRAFT_1421076 [Trametes cingulata]|nr:hypothetical protein OH77DRAFT_1421076 [Trametes cingulata]